ncbi:BA75_01471T0 [Komagataella pastoris]|uniref:BA75_01471T0 n=1 Tax=Komagataella pastoris TaxID=4922 RepID=A0A1B2J5M7_PICPA|nr:BA75_01471T0 [Komagataella pastoris]
MQSGWNCLHYALHFRNFLMAAMILQSFNSNDKESLVKQKDLDGFTPLDILSSTHITFFKHLPISINFKGMISARRKNQEEMFTFDPKNRGGSDILFYNSQSLSHLFDFVDHETLISYPLDILHQSKAAQRGVSHLAAPRVVQLSLSSRHILLATNDDRGNLFSCGFNNFGQLGDASTHSSKLFKPIEFFKDKKVVYTCSSNDHNLVISADSEVFTWGLNSDSQLGYEVAFNSFIQREPFSNVPRQVTTGDWKGFRNLIGCCCSSKATAVYSRKELFLWGQNNGQFGFTNVQQDAPRSLSFNYGPIKEVFLTDKFLLVLVDNQADLYIYINGFHHKLNVPLIKNFEKFNFDYFKPKNYMSKRLIKQIAVNNSSKGRFAILYDSGEIQKVTFDPEAQEKEQFDSSLKFRNCWIPSKLHLRATDVKLSSTGKLIISCFDGTVYKSASKSDSTCISEKFSKLVGINAVCKIYCDNNFQTFAFIRDELDNLPHQLHENDFFVDFATLSPLVHFEQRKKSKQVFNQSLLQRASFHTNFVETLSLVDKDTDEIPLDEDLFKLNRDSRWIPKSKFEDRYTIISDTDESILKVLDNTEFEDLYLSKPNHDRKLYDCWFCTVDKDGNKSIKFGCHESILMARCPALKELFNGKTLIHKNIQMTYDSNRSIISVGPNVTRHSILIFLHFVYTGKFLKVWNSFPLNKTPQIIKDTKDSVSKMAQLLQVIDPFGRISSSQKQIVTQLRTIKQAVYTDTMVKLADGHITHCPSSLLALRCAYFELLFDSWTLPTEEHGGITFKIIDFSHVSIEAFTVVLNFIYGVPFMELFNEAVYRDSSNFINFVFDVMELSDELMLFDLLDIAQLAIKDFVTIENVIPILLNVHQLNATQLFYCCAWKIYVNIDLFIFSPKLQSLISESDEELISRIDSLFKEFDRFKSTNMFVKDNWYNRSAELLVQEFIEQQDKYNLRFVPKGTKPLFETEDNVKSKTRSASATSSNDTRNSMVQELRRKAKGQDPVPTFEESASTQDKSNGNEWHIQVQNGRRRSSRRLTETESSTPSLSNSKHSLQPARRKDSLETMNIPRQSQRNSSNEALKAINSDSTKVDSLTPFERLVTPKRKTSPDVIPIKVKGSFKANKEERVRQQKLLLEPEPIPVSTPIVNNPWTRRLSSGPSSSNLAVCSSRSSPPSSSSSILGSKTPLSWSSRINRTKSFNIDALPSLDQFSLGQQRKTSIIEEPVKAEGATVSLKDVIQEQAFEKWWEEESLRVQAQMKSMEADNVAPQKKDKSKSRQKQGRNKKNNRSRNSPSGKPLKASMVPTSTQ